MRRAYHHRYAWCPDRPGSAIALGQKGRARENEERTEDRQGEAHLNEMNDDGAREMLDEAHHT
jgi:hypothetical protein